MGGTERGGHLVADSQIKVAPRRVLLTAAACVVGAVAGYFLGFAAVGIIEPADAGLDWIVYWLMAGAVGAWAGCLAGVWLARRVTGEDPKSSWLFWTIAVLLPFLASSSWLAVSFNDSDDNMPLVIEYALPVAAVALAIVCGKWLAARMGD